MLVCNGQPLNELDAHLYEEARRGNAIHLGQDPEGVHRWAITPGGQRHYAEEPTDDEEGPPPSGRPDRERDLMDRLETLRQIAIENGFREALHA